MRGASTPAQLDDLVYTDRENTSPIDEARSASNLALRDFAPFAAALIPFAMAIGTAADVNGLSFAQAAFGAVFILAGAAQLAAVELLGTGGGPFVIVSTVMLINLRFMLYGAGLARWFADASRLSRALLVFPLVDQTFMCCESRFASMTVLADRRRYYLTGTTFLVAVFLSSQVAGFFLGPIVPDWMGLGLAAPLAFTGMLVKAIGSRQSRVVAATSATTVVAMAALPGGLGLPVAILTAVFVGSRMEP